MSVLVIAEHDNVSLKPSTLHTITAARILGSPIHVLVAGHACGSVAESAARIPGLASILCCDDARYTHFLAESLSFLVRNLALQHTHILAPSTTFGKNFMPRVAALLDIQQISDVIAIKGLDTFVRPIYAGNALVEITTVDPIKILTIRGTAFDAALTEGGATVIDMIAATEGFEGSRYISGELSKSVRPELTAAKIIISGGRGMQNGKNFKLLEVIADRLGGAIGASRAAVDAGFVPNDFQVGQTGKIVAPDLYIAVGISGAIQHLAGMKDSRIIVAINKDPEAPIFQVADYGLVADLFVALPELAEELDRQLG